jgi:hypothetical protein
MEHYHLRLPSCALRQPIQTQQGGVMEQSNSSMVICGVCGDVIANLPDANVIYGIRCPLSEKGFGLCPDCVEVVRQLPQGEEKLSQLIEPAEEVLCGCMQDQ